MTKTIGMRAMSAVRSLGDLLRSTGLMYGGARDVYKTYGYRHEVRFQDCMGKYIRQDIAKRIVDMPANGLWSLPPVVKFPGSDQKAFSNIVDNFNLWQVFNRADKLAGMGSYSTILVGTNDGMSLEKPLRRKDDLKILYLQPYNIDHIVIETLEGDPSNPRYGKPLTYTLKRPDLKIASFSTSKVDSRIHYSRIIHIAENVLENDIYGHPRLVNVYNLLDDLLKVGGGSAEIYWLNARGGMQIDIDKEMSLQPEDEAALSEEVDDYTNDLRRIIRTRGTKINMLGSTVSDPRSTFQVIISLLSAATGIPQRILVGAEAGQLASAQDRANWSGYLEERRTSFAYPNVLIPFFTWMSDAGLIKPESISKATIDWPEAFKLSPLERSQTSAQQARAAANLSKVLQVTPQLMSEDSMRRIISLAAPTNDDIEPGEGETLVTGGGGFGNTAPSKKGTKPGNTPGKTVDTGTAKDKVTKD